MAAMVVPFVKSFQPLMPRASELLGPAASVKLTGMTRIFRCPFVQVDGVEAAPHFGVTNPATNARNMTAQRQRETMPGSRGLLGCMAEI